MPAPYSITALHNDYCIQPICIICLHPIQSRRCIMIIALQPQPVSARRNLPMEHPPLEALSGEGAADEELEDDWRCSVCKGDSGKARYSAGSHTCKLSKCRREYRVRRAEEKAARGQYGGVPPAKRARLSEPGPGISAAAGYAALIASKRCLKIEKVCRPRPIAPIASP